MTIYFHNKNCEVSASRLLHNWAVKIIVILYTKYSNLSVTSFQPIKWRLSGNLGHTVLTCGLLNGRLWLANKNNKTWRNATGLKVFKWPPQWCKQMSNGEVRFVNRCHHWCKNSLPLYAQYSFPDRTQTHLTTSSLDAPLTDGSATLCRIPSHRSSAHYHQSDTRLPKHTTGYQLLRCIRPHSLCSRARRKACPSNLRVSKDAPAQSQHTHSTSQPTTTLRSGEHYVFHTTPS